MSEPDQNWRAAWVENRALRIWEMRGPEVVAMHNLALPDGADALDALAVDPDDTRPNVVCGFGETPARVPCAPLAAPSRQNRIVAATMLKQDAPPVLSAGAEMAIAGYLRAQPKFDGVIVTVAGQTLWSHISAGEVVSMMGFDTPRLAVALDAPYLPGPGFDAALSDTQSRPERIAAHLAQARACQSGHALAHLVGAEIAAARPYWLGQFVVVLADDGAGDPYTAALGAQGTMIDAATLTPYFLAGCATLLDG